MLAKLQDKISSAKDLIRIQGMLDAVAAQASVPTTVSSSKSLLAVKHFFSNKIKANILEEEYEVIHQLVKKHS